MSWFSVLVSAKHRSLMYPKYCTHRFKIAERCGKLYKLENGGSDEAARASARAAAPPRYAQNTDGDAAVTVAEQQELSAFQLGQFELIRRQQSTIRRGFGQHRYRYINSFLFYPLRFSFSLYYLMMRKVLDDSQTTAKINTNTRRYFGHSPKGNQLSPKVRKEADKFFAREFVARKATATIKRLLNATSTCVYVVPSPPKTGGAQRWSNNTMRVSRTLALMVRACFRFGVPEDIRDFEFSGSCSLRVNWARSSRSRRQTRYA